MPFGPLEIGVVLVIVLVIFGPKRLPELGKSLGSGMKSFKDSVTGGDDDDKKLSSGSDTKAKAEPVHAEKSVHTEKSEAPAGGSQGS